MKQKIIDLLSNTRNLYYCLAAIVAVFVVSAFVQNQWGIALLDEISSPEAARTLIASFDETQKNVHAWFTGTADVILPFALGGLLAGIALRSFPTYGWYLALPSLLAIAVDLFEGVIQIMALCGGADLIDLKAFITPLKTNLYIVGLAIALLAGLMKIAAKFRS